jgi:hypothetical protein
MLYSFKADFFLASAIHFVLLSFISLYTVAAAIATWQAVVIISLACAALKAPKISIPIRLALVKIKSVGFVCILFDTKRGRLTGCPLIAFSLLLTNPHKSPALLI